jgi:tetratricopeptide (TPR) repeat protein
MRSLILLFLTCSFALHANTKLDITRESSFADQVFKEALSELQTDKQDWGLKILRSFAEDKACAYHSIANYRLALFLLKSGKFEEALPHIEQIDWEHVKKQNQLWPSGAKTVGDVHFILAELLEYRTRYEAALDQYTQALSVYTKTNESNKRYLATTDCGTGIDQIQNENLHCTMQMGLARSKIDVMKAKIDAMNADLNRNKKSP